MTDELPAKRHRGRLVDARLHLLDRQLLNEHDDPVGIVDDLELSGVELDRDVADGSQAPQVTALLSGRVVATRILGGAPPRSLMQQIPWKLVDAVGHRVGTVVDVRLSISGDLQNDPSTPRVVGLIVSPRTKSSFLGYERSSATAPTMLAALLRYRHRGTFLAGWEDVARVGATEYFCGRNTPGTRPYCRPMNEASRLATRPVGNPVVARGEIAPCSP
jgi:hypothetical protein